MSHAVRRLPVPLAARAANHRETATRNSRSRYVIHPESLVSANRILMNALFGWEAKPKYRAANPNGSR